MSILAQYGILGFYTSKDARAWDKLEKDGNPEIFRVFLKTNKVPAVQLIVSVSTSATMQLYTATDVAIGSPLTMTVESATGYKRIKYIGTTLEDKDDGDYYLKITNGEETYYSDVFGWTSNSDYFDELIKISAVSSDIRLGRTYSMNLTSFTFECYMNAIYLGLRPEFEDEVAQKDGSNNVLYGNLVPSHEFDLDATEYIYRFLLGLRVLEVNGTVTVTWQGKSYTANDIMAEITDEHLAGLMYQVKFSFVDHSEIISVNNETN